MVEKWISSKDLDKELRNLLLVVKRDQKTLEDSFYKNCT